MCSLENVFSRECVLDSTLTPLLRRDLDAGSLESDSEVDEDAAEAGRAQGEGEVEEEEEEHRRLLQRERYL